MAVREITRRICDEIDVTLAAVDETAVCSCVEAVIVARRVFVAGVGRSGWIMRCLAMRLMHLGKEVHVVGDATAPPISENDLLLVGSGSGRTPAILGFLDAAKRAGASVGVLTACADSAAAGKADVVVHLPAPTPKDPGAEQPRSIQPMGSLFEQTLLLLGDAMILLLAQRLEQEHDQMWQRHANLE